MLNQNNQLKQFSWELNNVIQLKNSPQYIFFCIGTADVIGDSLGPTVGSILKNKFKKYENIEIIGDLNNNVEYTNIENNLIKIKNKYNNSLVIVIDSALSKKNDIGKIFVDNRGLRYAQALEKSNNIIGNISIKVVVGEDCKNSLENFKNLINVSEKLINNLSNIVSTGIVNVMNKNM